MDLTVVVLWNTMDTHTQACTHKKRLKVQLFLLSFCSLVLSSTLPSPILNCSYSNLKCYPSLSFTQFSHRFHNQLASSYDEARNPPLRASLTTGWRRTRGESLLLKEISQDAAVVSILSSQDGVFSHEKKTTQKRMPRGSLGGDIPPNWLWQEFSWILWSPQQVATGQLHTSPPALCANRKPPAMVLHRHLQLPSFAFPWQTLLPAAECVR